MGKNKLNEKGDFNLDKPKHEDDEKISKDDTPLSRGFTSTLFADIPSFSKLFRQNISISCKETMNSELERRCKFNDLESAINYKFIDKTFLLEAMTHGSYKGNELTGDYQKLEFLGDFLLNFLVSRELELEMKENDVSPGNLSKRRSNLISNRVLAWLAVRCNFHFHLRLSCPFANSESRQTIGGNGYGRKACEARCVCRCHYGSTKG